MTIALGFVYSDGVMLGADSQFTVGSSKVEGLKVGHFEASWGKVAVTFAGNVDYATAAFQKCERAAELSDTRSAPLDAIEEILSDFYKEHIFAHPGYQSGGDFDYSMMLAIKLDKERNAKLYRTQDTILREVRSFDSVWAPYSFGVISK